MDLSYIVNPVNMLNEHYVIMVTLFFKGTVRTTQPQFLDLFLYSLYSNFTLLAIGEGLTINPFILKWLLLSLLSYIICLLKEVLTLTNSFI